jgi:predicted MFS family arabinose efflux permease
MILAAFPARLAYGMVGLGLYFKVHSDTHSIALAGLAAGANGIVGSLTTGLRSMAIERMGPMIPLRLFVPGYALALLLVNAVHGAILLIAAAAILGACAPPVNLSVRPMWKSAVPEEQYRTAIAIDTASLQTGVILGPPLVTILALSSHPASALLVTSLLIFVGGISLSLLQFTRTWEPEKRVPGAPSLFRSPAIRLLILEGAVMGFATGNSQIGIPALSTLHNKAHFAGIAFGVTAAAGILGSLLAGLLGKHILPVRGFRIIYIFWVLATIPIIFANPGAGFLAASAIVGFIGGAEQVFYLEMLEFVRPVGAAVSALGWLWTTEGSFAAIGQMSGGYISQHFSPHACFAITTAMMALGLTITNIGARWLVSGGASEQQIPN